MGPSDAGYTVLQWSLWKRNLELIEILLKAGADPQIRDTLRSWTAFEWAERWFNWEEALDLMKESDKAG